MKRILLDCDGVLADLVSAVSDMESYYSGILLPRHHNIDEWDNPIMKGIWKRLTNPELYYKWLCPYPGARYAVEELRKNYEVVISTHRPPESLPLVNWWQYNILRIEPLQVLFGRDKWKNGGDILIDDKSENVEEYAMHTGPAILVTRKWNEKYEFAKSLNPILRVSDSSDLDVSGIPATVNAILQIPIHGSVS